MKPLAIFHQIYSVNYDETDSYFSSKFYKNTGILDIIEIYSLLKHFIG
jgi:hypothetical protein